MPPVMPRRSTWQFLAHTDGRLIHKRAATGAAESGGFDGVGHEHGDGHPADAAGNGCEGSGGVHGVGMNVADEDGAFAAESFEALREVTEQPLSFSSVGDFVGANVNDSGAWPNPVGLHKSGFTHGGDDDIGTAD